MHVAKVVFNIQSISDIITNSSSEIFCRVESKEHIEDIAKVLNNIFALYGYQCYAGDEGIDFWIDLGAFEDNESVKYMFMALIKNTLLMYFSPDDFEILEDVPL